MAADPQTMEQTFENKLHEELHHYLVERNMVDDRLPECPDLENIWPELATAYLPDGMREFADYPIVSLGWPMFLGMAVAKLWDEDWEAYGKTSNLYESMRAQRGYDCMDEYILEDILHLNPQQADSRSNVAGNCAARAYSMLQRETLEPGTAEAFNAYVATIHQLYLMGVALQLCEMGYHMTEMQL